MSAATIEKAQQIIGKEEKVSFRKRILNYLLKSLEIAAPAIIMSNGGYYRPID